MLKEEHKGMWIFTELGFFSVVRKREDSAEDMLTVRGRVRSDLESLRSACLPGASPVTESRMADYRYRFRVSAREFGAALGEMARGIGYDNFKNEVEAKQGWVRHDIYERVWAIMRQLYCCDRKGPQEGGSN